MRSSWDKPGVRLTLPRDLHVAYVIGRMGAATIGDCWALHWTSPHTARVGFARLVRLGLLRSFQEHPAAPKFFTLTPAGLEWVRQEVGCEEHELRRLTGMGRVNRDALSVRNRFWTALILAGRAHGAVKLALFRPEYELRRARAAEVSIVPDALFVLEDRSHSDVARHSFMLEIDSGSERTAVLLDKAERYASARQRGPLYDVTPWRVLVLVPSPRRGQSVAAAMARGGAGAFTLLGVTSALTGGDCLGPLLWRAPELLGKERPPPSSSLFDVLVLAAEDHSHRLGSVAHSGEGQ